MLLVTAFSIIPTKYLPEALVVLLVLNFVWAYFQEKRESKEERTIEVDEILKLMVWAIWANKEKIRASVFLPDPKNSEILKIAYSYNMEGDIDRNLSMQINKGSCGKVFQGKIPIIVDLRVATHEQYLLDGSRIWPAMKTIVCVPIFDVDDKEKCVGALSVDSNLTLDQLKISQKLLGIINMFSDMIAKQLETD